MKKLLIFLILFIIALPAYSLVIRTGYYPGYCSYNSGLCRGSYLNTGYYVNPYYYGARYYSYPGYRPYYRPYYYRSYYRPYYQGYYRYGGYRYYNRPGFRIHIGY